MGLNDTGYHGVIGLITQRSLVQIQPAQREKSQRDGLRGGSRGWGVAPIIAQLLPPAGIDAAVLAG